MTTLEMDFSDPRATACRAQPWNYGDKFDFKGTYPNEIDANKLHLVKSSDAINTIVYFDSGILFETSRVDSNNGGASFGVMFDIRTYAHSKEIRVEVHFDYIQSIRKVTNHDIPAYLWPLVKLKRLLLLLISSPGIGLGRPSDAYSETHPFLGVIAAFTTDGDMTAAQINEKKDKMDAVTLQVLYNRNDREAESMRINPPFATPIGARFGFIDFPFLVDRFPCPIPKALGFFSSILRERWNGNPRKPYILELLVKASPAKPQPAGVGIRLQRSTDSNALEAFENAPLDPTRFQSNNWKDDLTDIKFAGASVVIGKIGNPSLPQGWGPARIRIKKLLVECN